MIAILFLAVLCILLIQPTVIAIYTVFEKHIFWPYQDNHGVRLINDGRGFTASSVTEAVVYGFREIASCRDDEGFRKMDDEFLISPNRLTLAVIGTGDEGDNHIRCIWMYSRSSDNRIYYSCNNHFGIEVDLTKTWKDQLVVNAGFSKLYEKHQAWIKSQGIELQPYDDGQELDEFMTAMRKRFNSMINKGYIRILDRKIGEWSYTVKGAIIIAFKNYFVDIYRQMRGA